MSASPHPPSALVAGHAASDVRTVRDLLARLGFARIDAVASREAAVGAMAANPPDLLVLGWDDPRSPVEEIVAAARSGPGEGPRVVVTMAAPTVDAVQAARALAVDSIVVVPFSPRTFLDRVPRPAPRQSPGADCDALHPSA